MYLLAERLLNRKVSTDFIKQPSDSLPLGSEEDQPQAAAGEELDEVTVDIPVPRLHVQFLGTIPVPGTASRHGL